MEQGKRASWAQAIAIAIQQHIFDGAGELKLKVGPIQRFSPSQQLGSLVHNMKCTKETKRGSAGGKGETGIRARDSFTQSADLHV